LKAKLLGESEGEKEKEEQGREKRKKRRDSNCSVRFLERHNLFQVCEIRKFQQVYMLKRKILLRKSCRMI
jgi:hypothetical protein